MPASEYESERAANIREQYRVESGIIRTPGKFEGQPYYVPYYWDLALEGCADRDDGKVFGFDITPECRELWPELPKRARTLKLIEDSSGFVSVL